MFLSYFHINMIDYSELLPPIFISFSSEPVPGKYFNLREEDISAAALFM